MPLLLFIYVSLNIIYKLKKVGNTICIYKVHCVNILDK